MEPRPLTTWEQKERDGLLALEIDEWRQKRRIAEDPNTTADILAHLFDDLIAQWKKQGIAGDGPGSLLAEAIAAHPNTPLSCLAELIKHSGLALRSFVHNPIAPLLLLEHPGFIADLPERIQHALLREEDTPPIFVALMAKSNNDGLACEAHMHIALAGEATTKAEWDSALNAHWQAFCRQFVLPLKGHKNNYDSYIQWHNDLAELGLAPRWAMEEPFWSEPVVELSPDAQEWLRFSFASNSPEESCLWEIIAPSLKKSPHLAAHVRRDATPCDLMFLLPVIGSKSSDLLKVIAAHPSANKSVLLSLYRLKPSPNVRAMIAANPNTPATLLEKLACDEDPLVRRLARRHPYAPYNALEISRHAVLKHIVDRMGILSLFVQFLAGLHGAFAQNTAAFYGQRDEFALRLCVALSLSIEPVLFSRDPASRTTRDLLEYLAHDGNRFVRWAAQTRLADPKFVFTWHDGET